MKTIKKFECKQVSALAWQVRRIEAERLNLPIGKVPWRRCVYLAWHVWTKREAQRILRSAMEVVAPAGWFRIEAIDFDY